MRLRWTTPATDDLYNIVQRIQKDNPAAAAEVATLYDGCGSVRDFPRRGRKRRIEGTREVVFPACLISLSTGYKIKL
jgi:plasmid stabilization system protein ParE